MDQANDQDYFVRRAAACRSLEQCASNPTVAAIHAEVAARYEQLATLPGRTEAKLMMVL